LTPKTPLQLAIFDCDGTLVDSQNAIITAMHLTCDSYNLDRIPRESIRRIVGLPLEIAMEHLFDAQSSRFHHEMAETYRHHFRTMRENDDVEEPLFPGTVAALDTLESQGWLLGVATGKAMRGLIPTLQTHNLQNKFTTLQTACRARGKPDPQMVENALAETGVEAKNAIVIGDTTYDIHMACNANVKSIGVAWGYHAPKELKEAGAALIINTYDELAEAINTIMKDR